MKSILIFIAIIGLASCTITSKNASLINEDAPAQHQAYKVAPKDEFYYIKPSMYKTAYQQMNNQVIKVLLFDKNGYKIEEEPGTFQRYKSLTEYMKMLKPGQAHVIDTTKNIGQYTGAIDGYTNQIAVNGKSDYYMIMYWFDKKNGQSRSIISHCENVAANNRKSKIKTIKVNMNALDGGSTIVAANSLSKK